MSLSNYEAQSIPKRLFTQSKSVVFVNTTVQTKRDVGCNVLRGGESCSGLGGLADEGIVVVISKKAEA